jgi:hypothetical protein
MEMTNGCKGSFVRSGGHAGRYVMWRGTTFKATRRKDVVAKICNLMNCPNKFGFLSDLTATSDSPIFSFTYNCRSLLQHVTIESLGKSQ